MQGSIVPQDLREGLLGHATEGVNLKHYGKVTGPKELKKAAVSRIEFPFIRNNLERLRYRRGDYVIVLKAEMARRQRMLANRDAKASRKAAADKTTSGNDHA